MSNKVFIRREDIFKAYEEIKGAENNGAARLEGYIFSRFTFVKCGHTNGIEYNTSMAKWICLECNVEMLPTQWNEVPK